MELLPSEKHKWRIFPFSFTVATEFHWSVKTGNCFGLDFIPGTQMLRPPGPPRVINTKPELIKCYKNQNQTQIPIPTFQQPSWLLGIIVLTCWEGSQGQGQGQGLLPLCVKAYLDRDKVIEDNSAYEHGCSFESTDFLIMCYSSGGILDAIFFDIFMSHGSVEQSKLKLLMQVCTNLKLVGLGVSAYRNTHFLIVFNECYWCKIIWLHLSWI